MSAAATSSLLSTNSACARNVSAFARPARAWTFFGSSRSARSYSPSASATFPVLSAASPWDDRKSTIHRATLPPAQAVSIAASVATTAKDAIGALLILVESVTEEELRDIRDHPRGRAEYQL